MLWLQRLKAIIEQKLIENGKWLPENGKWLLVNVNWLIEKRKIYDWEYSGWSIWNLGNYSDFRVAHGHGLQYPIMLTGIDHRKFCSYFQLRKSPLNDDRHSFKVLFYTGKGLWYKHTKNTEKLLTQVYLTQRSTSFLAVRVAFSKPRIITSRKQNLH